MVNLIFCHLRTSICLRTSVLFNVAILLGYLLPDYITNELLLTNAGECLGNMKTRDKNNGHITCLEF